MRDILTASISRMPWKLWNRWLISWTTLFRVLVNWLIIPKCDGVSKSGESTALNSYIGKGLKRLGFPSLKHAYDTNSKRRWDLHEFFPLSSLFTICFSYFSCAIFYLVIAHRPPPPSPANKMALRCCRKVCENEDDKDRCTLKRNLEGIKGTQFSISLEKNLLLIEKNKCGHTLTKWILFSRRNFKLRYFEGILVNCLTSP